jgi:hypothetical protein
MPVNPTQRFTKHKPCHICGGHYGSPKGVGLRCFGFLSDDEEWAHCTREEFAGGLPLHDASDTYAHRLLGDCRCGMQHDALPATYKPSGKPSRTIAATYDYCDETGSLLFQVVRYEPKEFKQRRPNGKDGWVWNLEGVDPVLYQFPELMSADPAKPVFICEGEKDVDRLIAIGLVATTNPMGAGKWKPEYARCLKGRSVVVVPDNDKAGSDHAAAVTVSLQGLAKNLKVLELPGLPEKGDTTDWLDQGHQVEELIELASAAAEWEPGSFRTSELTRSGESEERRFTLIPSTDVMLPDNDIEGGALGPYIPYPSSLVMLVGESSAGKTVLGKNMAYHLAEGLDWVGISPSGEQRVIYIDLESPENVFREHVEIIGRSENLVFARSLPTLHSPHGAEEFLSVCRQFSPDVIFLDSLAEAWPVQDENDNAEASRQMLAIKMIGKSLGCTVVVTWNMGEGNVKERFKARGATARVDRSDLVLNYTGLTDDTRQLKIVKSRYGTLNKVLTLRFAGELGFEEVKGDAHSSPSALAGMTLKVKYELRSGVTTRQELVATLGNEDLLDKVLNRLVQAGEVCRLKRGSYELVVSSESPNLKEKYSEETSDGGSAPDD